MPDPNQIYGLILAGGQSLRMQGQDKGLVLFMGRPLVEHVIQNLKNQVKAIYISCNRNFSDYQRFGYPLVSDQTEKSAPTFAGPLAGIIHGVSPIPASLVLVVPCDGPQLPFDLAARLFDALTREQADIAVVHDGQHLQPLYCLLKKSVLPRWIEAYQQGERSVLRCLQLQPCVIVDFSTDNACFRNINTHKELAELEQKLEKKKAH